MIRKLLASLDATLAQAWYILATFTPVLPWRWLLGLLAGAAICAGGVMLARSALQDIAYSYQSSSWPQTTGQVTETRLEQRGDDFRAIIRYRYQIGDADYSGETLSFDDNSSTDRAQAEATFESYPVGAMVQVFLPPQRPRARLPGAGCHASERLLHPRERVACCYCLAAQSCAMPGDRV